MTLSKLTTDLNIVSALADLPNATSGLTAAQLKAKFDEGSNDIKTYINDTLTVEVDSQLAAGGTALTTHKSSGDHDGRYYTQAQSDAKYETITDLTTNRKLSATGDFTGTLNGLPIVAAEPGLSTEFAALKADVTQRAINVKTPPYNATGNGVTEDTSAIQAAINALNDVGGGTIIIPPGTFLLGSPLTLYNNISIIGANKNKSVLYMKNNTSINMLYALQKSGITISNLTINGNVANNPFVLWPNQASQGIYFSKCSDVFITDVRFVDVCRAVCVAGDNTKRVTINNNHFINCQYAIDNYGARMLIDSNIFEGTVYQSIQVEPTVDSPYINYDSGNESDFYGTGTEDTYGVGTTVSNNIITGGTEGIIVHKGSYDTLVTNNNIQNCSNIGIYVKDYTTRTRVSDNIVRNITDNPVSTPENPWYQTGSGITVLSSNAVVENNTIEFCHTGIYALAPYRLTIKNNNIQRCRTSPICVERGNINTIVENNYCAGSPTYTGIAGTYFANGGVQIYQCTGSTVKNNFVYGDRLGRAWSAVNFRYCGAIVELNNQSYGTRTRIEGVAVVTYESAMALGGSQNFGYVSGATFPKWGSYNTQSIVFCTGLTGYPTMLICTTAGGGYSASWAASTAYGRFVWVKTTAGRIIMADFDGGTSGTTDPDNLEITDGTCKWKMSTGAAITDFWNPSTAYSVGNKVLFSDRLSYICTQAGTSGTTDPEGLFVDNNITWRYMAEVAAVFVNSVNGQNGNRTHAGAPTETPFFIGEEILDTTNGKWYKSKGLTSGDWVALN